MINILYIGFLGINQLFAAASSEAPAFHNYARKRGRRCIRSTIRIPAFCNATSRTVSQGSSALNRETVMKVVRESCREGANRAANARVFVMPHRVPIATLALLRLI